MTDATASAPQPLADEATMQEFITLNEQRAATYLSLIHISEPTRP